MKRFEFTIDAHDEFEIDNESMDNIKSYLCWCFKVDNVKTNIWDLPDWVTEWFSQHHGTDQEVPF